MITLQHGEDTIQIEENDPKLNKYLAIGWTIKN